MSHEILSAIIYCAIVYLCYDSHTPVILPERVIPSGYMEWMVCEHGHCCARGNAIQRVLDMLACSTLCA